MRGTEVSEFIDSAYTWQERADRAEAEAADWQEVAKQHMKKVCKLEAEVERLKEEAHQDIEWLYKEYVLEADVNLSQDAIDLKRKLRDMVCKELQAENALLHKVADAAKELVTQINNRTKTMGLDMSNYHAISITVKPGDAGRDYWEAVWAFEQALAELDKEGE